MEAINQQHFDVIIIGGGVSGLTAAALLSKAGLSVCLLEKQYMLGGYLQGFQRKEYNFDTAIHWLNQYGKNGTVTKLFRFIGNDFPVPQEMQKIQRHKTAHHDYTLTNHPDTLKAQLQTDFPHEKEGIEQFFLAAKKIANVSLKFDKLFRSKETFNGLQKLFYGLKQLRIIAPIIPYALTGSGEKGVKKGLTKFFKDENLHKLFCTENDLLSCLFPIAWAYNNDYQNPPIGGSQVIPKWLEENIVKFKQSKVLTSTTVTKIHVEHHRFVGVDFTNRAKSYHVTGDFLIAACDISKLYNDLLPKSYLPKRFNEKLAKADMYSSSVTISLILDVPVESLGFGTELIMLCDDSLPREEHMSGNPETSHISVLAPTSRDHTMTPVGQGMITLYVPAWMEYENYWQTERKPNGEFIKTEAYKALKEKFADIVIGRIEKQLCPTIREHIIHQEIATPITYYRYTHNLNGTIMGTRPGKENMQNKVARYQTTVPNIFIGGHWAELGGGVPIAVKAAFNSSLLVLKSKNKKAFQELVNHMDT